MKKFKKVMTITFALVLLLSVWPMNLSAATEKEDAQIAAQELYNLGLFQGVGTDSYGNPIFDLDRVPTRSEAVTMLIRLLGKVEEANSVPYIAPFDDVPNWAKSFVNYAYINGLTNGVSRTEFGGWQNTTASQYITFVLRALGYTSDIDFPSNRAWELSDKLGITAGEYNEQSSFTRGDVAIISRNALSVQLKGTSQRLIEYCLGEDNSNFGSFFEIHFIDVGEGDAALVICDGHSMLVDGGPSSASSLIYTYLKDREIDHLDYIVCTHPHEDHVGGLAGALNYASVDVAISSVKTYDSKPFESFLKYLHRQSIEITVPELGDTYSLGSAEVKVIGPINNSGSINNRSIVMRIRYGETSFLLSADAELEEEHAIIDAGFELSSTLLKVGHHGSSTSSGDAFLAAVRPAYAVISVGSDNPHGHPADVVLDKFTKEGTEIFRTDLQGDIVCVSDGRTLSFSIEKDYVPELIELIPLEPMDEGDESISRSLPTYILNTNTHKFHYPDCSSVKKMSEKNRQEYFGTREELLEMGYSPCGNCHP